MDDLGFETQLALVGSCGAGPRGLSGPRPDELPTRPASERSRGFCTSTGTERALIVEAKMSVGVAVRIGRFRMDRMTALTNDVDGRRLTVSVVEAARMLGIGRTLAYEAARKGDLRTIRVGRRVLVPLVAIELLLADPKEAATP